MSRTIYTVALARHSDLATLAAIELAAAELLQGHAPASVLDETTSEGELREAQQNGRLWVGKWNDQPVGFAHVTVREPDHAHLDEIDVHPAHGRRGLGTRLVRAVCEWAQSVSYQSVTLCTFRDVAFNAPFYASLGFEIVQAADLSPALRAILADETRRGLDPAGRVVMRRWC